MMNAKRHFRTRNQIRCFCIKCNGIYVDPRMKNKHSIDAMNTSILLQDDDLMIESSWHSSWHLFINEEFSVEHQEDVLQLDDLAIFSSKMRKRNRKNILKECNEINQEDSNSNEDDHEEIDNNINITDDTDNNYISSDSSGSSDSSEDNDNGNNDDSNDGDDGSDGDDSSDDNDGSEGDGNDETNIFKNYSSLDYNFPENFNDSQNIDEDWIIIFILKFQTRFRLPDTAIDTLIKFVNHVLTGLDYDQFKNFLTSLYTARKKVGLKH